MSGEKSKMATIAEIYNRVVWDSRLNRNLFIAGFHERRADEIREKPLVQWATSGDIPWHRVRYVRCGDVVVWDRERHIDLVSAGKLPDAAWKLQDTENSADLEALIANNRVNFAPQDVYRYQSQWRVAESKPINSQLDRLSLVSYNVLCDRFEADKIQTDKRFTAIIDELYKCDADIIALEEVTPELVRLLLEAEWVRDYFISESISAHNVKPYGNILMSRLPFTLVKHQFSGHKRTLVGTWLINDDLFHLAVVHLTSDRADNAQQKRSQQLATILAHFQEVSGNCAIVGDFNVKGDEQQELLTHAGFVDLWQELHPNEDGFTYDPSRNPLAALMSLEGKPARLDRILLNSTAYQPQSFSIFGCEPIAATDSKIYPSDHFGIRGVIRVAESPQVDLSGIRPVYQSAIAILPPAEVLPPIQAIRQRHDARFARWMPHINLIYGFLPESYFDEALKLIVPALAKLSPFQVTLADFQTFTHRRSSTAWLRPVAEPEGGIQQLQAVLQQLFPQCDEQGTKSAAGFTPHLSVGQFPNPTAAMAELPAWHPVSFTVDSVVLISRNGYSPFEVRHVVPLGSQAKGELEEIISRLATELTASQQLQRQTVLEIVKQACSECLGFPASLHLLGSARLRIASLQSDLDLVCLIPSYLGGDAFLHRVESHLQGLCDRSQVVLEAKFPALRFVLDGVSIDLLYSQIAVKGEGEAATITDLRSPQFQRIWSKIHDPAVEVPPEVKSIVGCLEADLMLDLVGDRNSFLLLLRAVRSWAKSRYIYGNSWGFLGGFSWAVLAAYICIKQRGTATIEELTANFFQLLSQHDWTQPIALTEAGKSYEVQQPRDWLPIVTSIPPCQNTARNITRSTAQIIKAELARGAEISALALAGKASWEELFVAPDLADESYFWLAIEATGEDKKELDRCAGVLEGYASGAIVQLEQLGVFARPIPRVYRNGNNPQIRLGLTCGDDVERGAILVLVTDFFSQFGSTFAARWD